MEFPAEAFLPGPRVTLPGTPGGPLAGLTFAAKDLFDVAGHPTGGGNPDWAASHPTPARHAWAVRRLLDAGAELVGKTVTCEISLGILGFNPHEGTPPNPAAPGCLPGGSSSGSASAVAAGACDIALGTDSGGSVRVPASLCGLYGMRPTLGAVSVEGVLRQAETFDTAGWFARDAATFARAASALLNEALPEPSAAGVLVAEDAFAIADAEVREALAPALARIGGMFGGVTPIALAEPGELEVWGNQRNICQRAEAWRNFSPWIDRCNPRFGFSAARNLAFAATITPEQFAVANSVRARVVERMRALLEGGAILCIPTTPFTAPPLGLSLSELDRQSGRIGLLCSIAGMASLPQLSLPLGTAGGKPCGLSIICWRGADARLAAIALALENAR
ncbi:amidase [Plastoroseomonas arctica]|uniref:Amidase n=1 Tax=Plastoroseomonas arctica TaxID=1509237 RepID=A0AAF1JX60_9PROT|nr:amidase [Plastoroseomonas arctica]MBR0655897.1 amidase [Plastoroseomonas arctica]